jgi:hypothetical protein
MFYSRACDAKTQYYPFGFTCKVNEGASSWEEFTRKDLLFRIPYQCNAILFHRTSKASLKKDFSIECRQKSHQSVR